jgi:hypothetical protein
MEYFDYIKIPNENALAELEKLRNDFSISKKYPFLIGRVRQFTDFRELDQDEAQEIIALSKGLEATEWFKKCEQDVRANEWFDEEILGVWEDFDGEREDLPYILKENLRNKVDNAYIGLADISESWMLPAFLRFGGWNECASPDAQCSIMRYWQEKYGAEILSVSDDVIECTVKNPPQTRAEAMKLAWEQYLYCADIVDQGTQTVSNLGALLLNANLWFFWWD